MVGCLCLCLWVLWLGLLVSVCCMSGLCVCSGESCCWWLVVC